MSVLVDNYGGQRFAMRNAVKARVLELLATDPVLMSKYQLNSSAVRLAIITACDKFIKPTRKQNVIDNLAEDIVERLGKGEIVNYYV